MKQLQESSIECPALDPLPTLRECPALAIYQKQRQALEKGAVPETKSAMIEAFFSLINHPSPLIRREVMRHTPRLAERRGETIHRLFQRVRNEKHPEVIVAALPWVFLAAANDPAHSTYLTVMAKHEDVGVRSMVARLLASDARGTVPKSLDQAKALLSNDKAVPVRVSVCHGLVAYTDIKPVLPLLKAGLAPSMPADVYDACLDTLIKSWCRIQPPLRPSPEGYALTRLELMATPRDPTRLRTHHIQQLKYAHDKRFLLRAQRWFDATEWATVLRSLMDDVTLPQEHRVAAARVLAASPAVEVLQQARESLLADSASPTRDALLAALPIAPSPSVKESP